MPISKKEKKPCTNKIKDHSVRIKNESESSATEYKDINNIANEIKEVADKTEKALKQLRVTRRK